MKYGELVEVSQGFQASVNLEYDLNKTSKIRSYIPTEQSVRVLGSLLETYYYNSSPEKRASVLIGPYGRGKSHLLLILSALTSLDTRARNSKEKKKAREIQYNLCDKIESVDPKTGSLARAVVDSSIRSLPVIINSNSTDINQSFLIAINDALAWAGLQNLLPDTYFDSALELINKWHSSYPNAYKKLCNELKKFKVTDEDLKIGLSQFDQKYYTIFCKCYPHIAAGTEFNPLANMDVVKLYLAVVNALCEQTEYRGITVIFDEFSKFLEANLDKSKMLNFKIIQDMAEAAVRSGNKHLHFICITHKDILDYSSSDSFKTVEGRFNKLRFVASSEQSYELISNAIIKKESFGKFKDDYSEKFKAVASMSATPNVFRELSDESYERNLVYGCFPLTPLSAFALLHVSELVGQNERTLFTFLSQNEKYTLQSFLSRERENFSEITIDYIYGYFEEQFKKEIFNPAVHSIWSKTDSALRQTSDLTQGKILKAIAVINIIKDERLKAVPAHIKAALLMTDDEFDNAIRELLKKHILSQRDSSEYVLLTANGVDIQKSIDNYIKTSLPKVNICETLSDAYELGYVLPREYNDKFSILRRFKKIYMDASVFVAYKNAAQLLSEYSYDGLIIHIVWDTDDQLKQVNEKIEEFKDAPQVVLCLTEQPFTYEELLKQFVAAKHLRSKDTALSDPHFMEELEVFIDDLGRRIQTVVNTMYAPSSEMSYYINCNGNISITKQVELNHAISHICEACYALTPKVNNEMVNKENLNSQNLKARDIVVDWLFSHASDEIIPCMEGYGPQVSIFKSAFKYTGLDKASTVEDEGMNEVLGIINDFISSCEANRKSFKPLYDTLLSAPYGMRKGIIPLYIAYVMRQYSNSIVLYFKNHEIELSASILSNLNDSPDSYELLVETGTAERSLYLDKLEELFANYSDAKIQGVNRIYSIVKSMQRWMRSLPDYTKKYKQYLENGEFCAVSPAVVSVRNELMKFEINSRDLLFNTWVSKLTESGKTEDCFETISKIKTLLDTHMAVFRHEIQKKLAAMFIPGYQGGLSNAVMTWYRALPDATKMHVFDVDSNTMLSIANSLSSYNDDELLDSLAFGFTAIAIEDWNDSQVKLFLDAVEHVLSRINNFTEEETASNQEGRLQITIGEKTVDKVFSADSISPLGGTALANLKSVFEEYNDSLEPDEQLAIIAKLIGDIIH